MAGKEKRPAEMEAPTGTIEITLPDYNTFSGEEQEKAVKIMELLWMALQVNGLSDRNSNWDPSNTLPTVFFKFSGHVSFIEFSCYMNGYKNGCDTDKHNIFQEQLIRVDTEKECFFEDAEYLGEWLHSILKG